jgi:protein-L-isoaspartate(D-aspartate) O-methyltransferase
MKIEEVRKAYAEAVCDAAKVTSPLLREALATVPREKFLGPGPWFVRGPQPGAAGLTEDADPARVYQNVSIAIDRERELFNGQPAPIAAWLEGLGLRPGQRVLHIGCGTGYYTALIASVVGADGRVFAIEVEAELASRAQEALADWRNVHVSQGDGRTNLPDEIDVVLIHAGGTHVVPEWLDATRDGARLLAPLTVSIPAMSPTLSKGVLLHAQRLGGAWRARIDSMIAIYSLVGLRDDAANGALGQALMRGPSGPPVTSIRRDAHAADATCWLHVDGACVSAKSDP